MKSDQTPEKYSKYGVWWAGTTLPVVMEMSCIQEGGRWKSKWGPCGAGLFHHYKAGISALWPEVIWHRWNDLLLKEWLDKSVVGVLGPANASKTHSFAMFHLFDWYCFPTSTTTIVCSTTRERLEDRIWGEIKKFHKLAKKRYDWIPGHLIEGRQRIVADAKTEASEGRDFRNGLLGVPCKTGGKYVGLGDFIGIKNKRVRLAGDELQLLPKAFIDCIPNLLKNPECKITGMGNPKDTIDALGSLCEPAASLGGWDSGIDQEPKTKTWRTKWADGVCVQLCGSDSPNMDVPLDAPVPFPFLITRKSMQDDAAIWGENDWHYTMFNEGRMPRGQGSRRVITAALCRNMGALGEPRWHNKNQVEIAFLDAAYRSVGGDRCVFGRLKYGLEASEDGASLFVSNLINQTKPTDYLKNILSLEELSIIELKADIGLQATTQEAEDQIVQYVKRECTAHGIPPHHFFYDSGMRTSLVNAFDRLWTAEAVPIDCGGVPSDRMVSQKIQVKCSDYYRKYITELWFSVRYVIEAGQFRGLTEEAMMEGCAREWKMVGNNKIEVESKREMRDKVGKSPDFFDAIAIGVEGARRCGFVIARLGELEYKEANHHWKRDLKERARRMAESGSLKFN